MHLKSVEHICQHLGGCNSKLHPPKSDDRYAQLTRGAFIINDFLQNPHFSAEKNEEWFVSLIIILSTSSSNQFDQSYGAH